MRAIIIGGGIAGLASALALTRRGWRVEVFERAPEFTEVGAGLSLWPNALRALDAEGITVEDVSLRRPTLDEVFLALTGKPAQTTEAQEQEAS